MATIDRAGLTRIDDGPVATVYSGRHAGAVVALKVFPKRLDKRTLAAFNKEQAKLSTVRRVTSILPVHGVDELDTGEFVVRMERCTQSLATLIDRVGPLRPADAVVLGRAVAIALAAAHGAGVVHGGISPHNILFRTTGEPVVADFGVTLRQAFARDPLYAIEFLPPETLRTGTLNEATDLYGLGAVLHYALSGRSPHPGRLGEQPGERVLRILGEPVPAINNPDVPVGLSTLVARLLAADPARRLTAATAVSDQLTAMLPGAPHRPPTHDFDDFSAPPPPAPMPQAPPPRPTATFQTDGEDFDDFAVPAYRATPPRPVSAPAASPWPVARPPLTPPPGAQVVRPPQAGPTAGHSPVTAPPAAGSPVTQPPATQSPAILPPVAGPPVAPAPVAQSPLARPSVAPSSDAAPVAGTSVAPPSDSAPVAPLPVAPPSGSVPVAQPSVAPSSDSAPVVGPSVAPSSDSAPVAGSSVVPASGAESSVARPPVAPPSDSVPVAGLSVASTSDSVPVRGLSVAPSSDSVPVAAPPSDSAPVAGSSVVPASDAESSAARPPVAEPPVAQAPVILPPDAEPSVVPAPVAPPSGSAPVVPPSDPAPIAGPSVAPASVAQSPLAQPSVAPSSDSVPVAEPSVVPPSNPAPVSEADEGADTHWLPEPESEENTPATTPSPQTPLATLTPPPTEPPADRAPAPSATPGVALPAGPPTAALPAPATVEFAAQARPPASSAVPRPDLDFDDDFADDIDPVRGRARARVLASPLAPPGQAPKKLVRYDVLAGAALLLALLALVPLLLFRGDPEEISSAPKLPPAGGSGGKDVEIKLDEPVDLTDKVRLTWTANEVLDFIVVVAAEGKETRYEMAERNLTLTYPVDEGRQYCFRVQGTDGNDTYESNVVSLRNATCTT